jgi:hypothetical protein
MRCLSEGGHIGPPLQNNNYLYERNSVLLAIKETYRWTMEKCIYGLASKSFQSRDKFLSRAA